FVSATEDPPVRFAVGTSHQDSLTVAVLDAHTGSSQPIARVPRQTRFAATLPDGRTIYISLPLQPRLSIAVGSSSIFLGYPSKPAVDQYATSGETIHTVSLPLSGAPLTPELRRAWQTSMEEGVSDEEKPLMARYLESLPYPEVMPAFDRLVVD